MKIQINGKQASIKDGTSILSLLLEKKIKPDVVVVELNGKIIQRNDFQNVILKPDDILEVIFFMGGG